MSGSSFGTLFRVTTFGESHCKGVGAIVDGCPPGMRLSEADVQPQLTRRRPGQSRLTTPRSETDTVTILSGTERGITLGTPICLTVPNENTKPGDYAGEQSDLPQHLACSSARLFWLHHRCLELFKRSRASVISVSSIAEMTAIPRPGHADYTYHIKYGVHASSGGGRSSARETIGRVAAGAIAEKWLRETYGTAVVTFVSSVGPVDLPAEALRRPDGSHWTRADVDRLGSLGLLRDAGHSGWRNVRASSVAEAGSGAAAGASSGASAASGAVTGSAAAALTPAQKAEQATLDAADEALFVAAYRRRCPAEAGPYAAEAEAKAASASADGAGDPAARASAGSAGAAYVAGTPCYEDADGMVYDMDGAVVPPRSLLALADASSGAGSSASGGAGASAAAADAPLSPDEAARVEAFLAQRRSDEMLCLRCPHAATACRMASQIRLVKAEEDSAGGVLTTVVTGAPMGLGEPVFDKAEALLAHAMLSLPATKGFEIGSGFAGTRLRGSQHNDAFVAAAPAASGGAGAGASGAAKVLLRPATNNAGGTLGGITSGAELVFRVPIKPVSTIGRAQATATYGGEEAVLEAKGRHDPCVLPRAPPLLEAMTALVLADLALIQRSRAPHGMLHVLPAAVTAAADDEAGADETSAGPRAADGSAVGRKRKHNEI